MVQKSKRGRPRGYDPDAALAAARDAFWDEGYAATSLDDLSARMEMNRPSLYGAFGDKRALYHLTLGRYREASRAGLTERLSYDLPLREALQRVLRGALAVYLSAKLDVDPPPWTQPAIQLPDPWFASPGPAIRNYLLLSSPASFRSRNLFIDEDSLIVV